jgi:hypothetical protein
MNQPHKRARKKSLSTKSARNGHTVVAYWPPFRVELSKAAIHSTPRSLEFPPQIKECRTVMRLTGFLTVLIALSWAGQASAQNFVDGVFKDIQRANARGSLAALGIAGLPDDSASAIALQSTGQSDSFDYKSAQLGGGFRLGENTPLYLEGYIGYNRYDPVLFLSGSGLKSPLPLKWTSVAATGGIGWEFDLSDYWVFRPMVHLSLGRVQSDSSVAAQVISEELGFEDVSFAQSGGIWAGGYGASLALAYRRRWESDQELEVTLRHTELEYRPIGDDKDLLVRSRAANAVLWSRYRFPTGWRLWNRPVRGVTDFSASYLAGDQKYILQTDWLARIGIGGEVDFSETWVPIISTTRIMVRYYEGESVKGYSAGLSVSF